VPRGKETQWRVSLVGRKRESPHGRSARSCCVGEEGDNPRREKGAWFGGAKCRMFLIEKNHLVPSLIFLRISRSKQKGRERSAVGKKERRRRKGEKRGLGLPQQRKCKMPIAGRVNAKAHTGNKNGRPMPQTGRVKGVTGGLRGGGGGGLQCSPHSS